MFDKFGEFNSAEAINLEAARLVDEGDTESLNILAEENGLDKEDVIDLLEGCAGTLTNPLMAAYGKLHVEAAALTPYEIMQDWIDYIKVRCAEDESMARAVRVKGKNLKGCIAALLKWSMNNAKPVDEEILKECGITYKVTLGIPGIGTAKKIITEYYMGV